MEQPTKVFVISNRAMYHDSSYFDIIAVTMCIEDAHAVLGTVKKDFLESVENGYFSPDFTDFANLNITEEEYTLHIEDNVTHMYEEWTVTKMELHNKDGKVILV